MPNTEQARRYREIRRLGVGGMATVTLAEDTVLGRPVALKRVHSGGDSRGMLRLKREAMVGASLNHPNLVFVYDAQLQEDGDVVIVMEYVEGETLADRISSRGALPPAEAIAVLRGVAGALDAIHGQGIVHRDVKPANVLLGQDGTVKLADLGVADVADRTRITESGAVVGSFSYMAAEQLNGAEPSPAMDVYALAAVAYETLTGKKARPESNPLALAHAISTQPAPDLRDAWPAAPPGAAAVLQRSMSADPAQRPASAGELVRRLEAAFEPERPTREVAPVGPRRAPAGPRMAPEPSAATNPASPPPRPRRRPFIVPALLALAALAVAGVLVAALGSGGTKSSGSSASTPRTSAHRPAATTGARSATSTTGTTASSSSASTASTGTASTGTASTSSTPSAPGAASSGAPAAAVEQFYTAAARHDYPAAWGLAGPNLRTQLGGYAAFQHLFSSVRSITFQSAQATGGSSATTATVALRTTSVQTDRTQQCSGTAQTIRTGGRWLVDHISITCA